MRIGLVLANVPGYSETFFNNKIKGLKGEGHEVVLFVGSMKRIGYENAKVYYGPALSGSGFSKLFSTLFSIINVFCQAPLVSVKFLRLELSHGASWSVAIRRLVINSHILPHKLDWLHFGFATMGIGRELVGKAIGAKVAVSFRGYDISIYPLKHPGCYKRLWQHVDKVHTISDDLLQIAYSQGLPTELPVSKITPAIDASIFLTLRSGFFDNTEIRMLSVGRLHWKKGFEYTFEALALAKGRGVKFKYTIIGEGEERERLVFAAHQLGISDNVTFAGKISHSDIPGSMKENDIYLQYSIQEGFCNSVLEAQAAGMLCLVSDAEGLQENVLDGKTGWVVPKRNPALLAQKILEVIYYPQNQLLSVSQAAARRVTEEFNLEKQRKEFVQFYSE